MFSSGVVSVFHFPLAAGLSQRQMFIREIFLQDHVHDKEHPLENRGHV